MVWKLFDFTIASNWKPIADNIQREQIKMWFPDFIAEFLFRRCLKMSFKMATSMSCKVQTSWVSNSSVVDLIGLWKWSSAHALGGVSGVASFITTDEQLHKNRGCCFLVQAMLPEGFPFYQLIITFNAYKVFMRIMYLIKCWSK